MAIETTELIAEIAATLRAAGIDEPRREALLLLEHTSGLGRTALRLTSSLDLSPDRRLTLDAAVRRRAAREPMAYILGEREFWSLPLRVGPGVLVPRPESETVVEAALACVRERLVGPEPPLAVLDLGTGSGCLLLAILSELPAARGLGVDWSVGALQIASANACSLGLAERAQFRRGCWGRGLDGRFDLIVSNPPYIAAPDLADLMPEVREYEPRLALEAGADGLESYRDLAPDLARLLADDGLAGLEIGAGQADAVEAVLAREGLETVLRRPDLQGIPRCLVVRRTSSAQS